MMTIKSMAQSAGKWSVWVVAIESVIVMAMVPQFAGAQPDTLWTRTYGGIENDCGESVIQASDGGFIVAGYSAMNGPGNDDVYLMKTDANGDILWSKTYGGPLSDRGYSVTQTSEGEFVIAGYTDFYGVDVSDVYLIKTDANGDTVWTMTYGGPSSDRGYSIIQTDDGGFAVTGHTWLQSVNYEIYVIRTDAYGDTLWTRTYGGVNNDQARSIAQTSDGGFIITGYTETYSSGSSNIYLVRTDPNGDLLWEQAYGGIGDDWGYDVAQTSDGGYIIVGWTSAYGDGNGDVYLIRTDTNGDVLWAQSYGGNQWESGYSVTQSADGGFVVAGTSSSYGSGGYDVYLIKVNSLGDTLWTRTYGSTGWEQGSSIARTSDDGYIVAGWTNSYGVGETDIYLLRFGSDPGGIMEESTVGITRARLCISPNPSCDKCYLTYGTERAGHYRAALYDMAGRMVMNIYEGRMEPGEHRLWIDTSTIASGIYVVHLATPDGSQSVRMAKIR
jgi:regulation of enolase protein 1 (concanavalin A-like superfamily)